MRKEEEIVERMNKAKELMFYYLGFLPQVSDKLDGVLERFASIDVHSAIQEFEMIAARESIKKKYNIKEPKSKAEARDNFDTEYIIYTTLQWVLDLRNSPSGPSDSES